MPWDILRVGDDYTVSKTEDREPRPKGTFFTLRNLGLVVGQSCGNVHGAANDAFHG